MSSHFIDILELPILFQNSFQAETYLRHGQGRVKSWTNWARDLGQKEVLVSFSTQPLYDCDSNNFNGKMLFAVVFSEKLGILDDISTGYIS
ncbi:hypothetical protein TNCV_2338781 [Trichonephila clavipes]|nr:hypothetical protein TNCV_2338781 [Trichonephila clavipes]